MHLRSATPADIPAIATVILASVGSQAPWNAFVGASSRNNPDLVAHVERIVRGYVEANENEWIVQVMEVNKDGRVVVAAVAVWDTRASPAPVRSGSKTKDTYHDAVKKVREAPAWTDSWTLDGQDKLNSLVGAMEQARSRFFAGSGPQVFLRLLATGPDHQRKGYAKALCESGLDIAWRRQSAVCLETGPRGYILFSGLGFSDLGAVTLPVHGGDEHVLKALRMDVSKAQESHPGVWNSFWNYVRS